MCKSWCDSPPNEAELNRPHLLGPEGAWPEAGERVCRPLMFHLSKGWPNHHQGGLAGLSLRQHTCRNCCAAFKSEQVSSTVSAVGLRAGSGSIISRTRFWKLALYLEGANRLGLGLGGGWKVPGSRNWVRPLAKRTTGLACK